MPSPAYNTFLASMQIDYNQWHDGEGYDLAALDQLAPAEKQSLETTLLARADRDWRDLEALARLNTPRAWDAIARVARTQGAVALYAARALAARPPAPGHAAPPAAAPPAILEAQLLQSIRTLGPQDDVAQILDTSEAHPTAAVQKALLEAARFSANPTFRVHAAALLFYFAKIAGEPFDWSHRPFFLKFASAIPRDLAAAHDELRQKLAAARPGGAVGEKMRPAGDI